MNIHLNKTKIKSKQIVFFVCVENAERYHMTEVFFRQHALSDSHYDITNAGTEHTCEINHIAVKTMSLTGIDISKQKPKELNKDLIKNARKIINMDV